MSENRGNWLVLVCVISWFIISSEPWSRPIPLRVEERDRLAKSAAGDSVDVALVSPGGDDRSRAFCEGVRMAVEEVNREGGIHVLGDDGRSSPRQIRLREFDSPVGEQADVRI